MYVKICKLGIFKKKYFLKLPSMIRIYFRTSRSALAAQAHLSGLYGDEFASAQPAYRLEIMKAFYATLLKVKDRH
jgi:hypothetical protein